MKKLIAEFNNKYSISETGEVLNVLTGRTIKPFLNNNGYLLIKVSGFGGKAVHRLVAKYFISNPENKPEVNHKDANKLNVHYTNLEWATRKENFDHACECGIMDSFTNARMNRIKLSINDAADIIKLRSTMSAKQLSIKYNVDVKHIYRIINGTRYKNLSR